MFLSLSYNLAANYYCDFYFCFYFIGNLNFLYVVNKILINTNYVKYCSSNIDYWLELMMLLKVVLIILIIDYNLLSTSCVKQVWK